MQLLFYFNSYRDSEFDFDLIFRPLSTDSVRDNSHARCEPDCQPEIKKY